MSINIKEEEPILLLSDDSVFYFNKYDRRKFIKKVYITLFFQLLCTISMAFLFMYYEPASDFVKSDNGKTLLYVSIALMFSLLIALMCNQDIARKKPVNYIILSIFTLSISYLVGYNTIFYDTISVIIAFGTTCSITIVLTLYAWQTKYDYTTFGGILLSFLFG